ncbi:ABC transporter ATP-binding protein [Blastococcus sp. Marseille-P5729]|uniref:ABC transporter ATP-binding protein n=1 Tax=Blastococcus sp. Marseille-P5729 TaxID=2086582 RepID=UPI000D0E72DF|nr:ABC transporter ATP-binding protein [Blastococcus sp. Marseille-P5729]
MSTPVIEVTDLKRRYGGKDGFEAVKGVSFAVHAGELFALLGTNGAGKTSALEVAEGIAPPAAGSVAVLGLDPYTERTRVRPHMGIMLQQGGLPDDLTVRETATMWAGTLDDPRPVDDAIAMVELTDRSDVRVASLSGGERRRVDLALALMGNPKALFLDEPTTGLDPQSRRTTWELVRRLKADGCAVVLTTHYLDEAEELADRLAIMHQGEIVTEGTAAEIAQAYPATITLRGVDARRLPTITGSAAQDGDRTTTQTRQLQRDLTTLMVWAERERITLDDLHAREASVEEAFLAIAGKHHEEA